jgi:hypothetical protein
VRRALFDETVNRSSSDFENHRGVFSRQHPLPLFRRNARRIENNRNRRRLSEKATSSQLR